MFRLHEGDPLRLASAWAATAWYLAATILFTWPLAPGLLADIPSDLIDPLLNCWILGWDADHLLRFVTGDLGALQGFWHGNIFHPAPLALAYSEHLIPQAVQILPVYAATGNLVLCHNLLFLSTFVLCGLGVYLLVRDLTGNARAAFLAGLLFAFVPYRIAQSPHVQVLSTQWMAFTLLGLRRFLENGRLRALAGASAAWLAQNLSCGYFLLFFSPAAVAFIGWEVVRRGLWRRPWMLAALLAAVAFVALATAPFLLPYLELRNLGFNTRTPGELERFSANLLAYLTTTDLIHGWGRVVRAFPAAEGELFPGVVLVVLALAGSVWLALDAWRERGAGGWRRFVRIVSAGPGFWVVTAFLAAWLSLGPTVRVGLREFGAGPYGLLYRYVPGFDGLRVPARFGLVAALALAVLAGLGLDRLSRSSRRGGLVLAALALVFITEALPAPIDLNIVDALDTLNSPAPHAWTGPRVPRVYRYLKGMPREMAVIEFPFGVGGYEAQYVYYASQHWHPIVNGYSGVFPPTYRALLKLLGHGADYENAWSALSASGARLAVVHESAYRNEEGVRLSEWMERNGAQRIAKFPGDSVFLLPW